MRPGALRSLPTPETLFARYRATGDPEALGETFDAVAPGLFRLALSLVPDAATAEDALQETFLFAMEEAGRWDGERPLVPWLTGVLRLKVKEVRRRHGRSPDPDRVVRPPAPDDPAAEAVTAEERERIHAALQRLPEPYRGVALLRWRYGLEPAEIADVRGVPPGTVWSLLHRALRKLKAEVAALPALLLAFRAERGIEGVRAAVVRRSAAHAGKAAGIGGAGAALVTGGALVSTGSKIAVGVAVLGLVAAVAWMLSSPGSGDTGAPLPPPVPPAGGPPSSVVPPAPADPPRPGDPVARGPSAPGGRPIPWDPSLATATIRVRTTAEGTLPRMRPLRLDADPKCGDLHPGTLADPTIRARDGRLANVIAWVSEGASGWRFTPPAEPVLLDQKGCMYEPHVFTLMVGQPLRIRNSDPAMHNIHAVPKVNDEFNFGQIPQAADQTKRFRSEEVAVKIKCDVHGWMTSWAGVFSHPFHGVTGDEGTTTLRVPPGEYRISAWHEYDGFEAPAPRTVKVADGGEAAVEFVFRVR